MYFNSAMFFLGLSLLVFGTNGKVISFLDPCPIGDNACIMTSAQKVKTHLFDKENVLKIKSIDPLEIPTLNGDIGELKIGFKDLSIKGARECELKEVKRDEELKIFVEVVCPVSAIGNYKVDGELLNIPIFGNGLFKFETDKIKLALTAFLKLVDGKDGKKHYKIHKFDFTYDTIGDVHIDLDNLYDGDKKRAEQMNNLIHSSGKELVSTVGKNVIKEVCSSMVDVFRDIIIQVPIEEING